MNTTCMNQPGFVNNLRSLSETAQTLLHPVPRSTIRGFIAELRRRLLVWRERRIDRAAFSHLLALDDALLDDIGLTRDSVIWAAQLPLTVDAAAALESAKSHRG